MDWFERITGFVESGYENTRARLTVEDGHLRSLVNNVIMDHFRPMNTFSSLHRYSH